MSDYKKPATTYTEQIQILENRNLIIDDKQEAYDYLKSIGYFRLSGYWLTFYEKKDKFIDGSSFKNVIDVYEIDRKLRILLLGLLEDIEINYKTLVGHFFSFEYSPLDHYNEKNFQNTQYYKIWYQHFEESVQMAKRRNELYVKHYSDKYQGMFPIWTAMEMESFGDVSKFYSNLQVDLKKKIASQSVGFSYIYLENWLYTLSVTRNICAHNSRLYDKQLKIKPRLQAKEQLIINNSYIFSVIYTCKKMCLEENQWIEFYKNLKKLLNSVSSCVKLEKFGFPQNWEDILNKTKIS